MCNSNSLNSQVTSVKSATTKTRRALAVWTREALTRETFQKRSKDRFGYSYGCEWFRESPICLECLYYAFMSGCTDHLNSG
ncbi:uncharacterized protein [Periplaneta americana]|uniref:uncharacterized protein isoform X4 n=1 Tax=Periplaneta americana TaxID=6978 RepID=UPI0037E7131E